MPRPHEAGTILIVEDEPVLRAALTESVRQMGFTAAATASGEEALAYCEGQPVSARPQVVLTDVKMSGMNGLQLLDELHRRGHVMPVILISGVGTIETAVEAMKRGARDFLVKPFSPDALQAALQRAVGAVPAAPGRQTGRDLSALRPLMTRNVEMIKLLKVAEIIAASHATVLIQGESGTGKELLARLIHERSPRAHRPFIAINCAAVPDNLLESELFGYEKGAFTGAAARKPGRFELAHTGTILLDEISEMPLPLQAKLLRVLQEREVDVLGGKEPMTVDIRVITTTNRPLWDDVKTGRFREDLYYRLNVIPLRIPPLRNRLDDLPLLTDHFIRKAATRHGKGGASIAPDVLAALSERTWPGNVRELENVIERAVLLAGDGQITSEHLLLNQEPDRPRHEETPPAAKAGLSGMTIWEAERALILGTLEQVGGNRTLAARLLDISIRTLRNKLREYRDGVPVKPSPGARHAADAADSPHVDDPQSPQEVPS